MKKSVIINILIVAACLLIGYDLASSCTVPVGPVEDAVTTENQTSESHKPQIPIETENKKDSTEKPKKNETPEVKAPSSKDSRHTTTKAIGNRFVKNFSAAKNQLKKIYPDGTKTFYCDCLTSGDRLDTTGCGLSVSSYKNRATKIEWEHVVPASLFGKGLKEWDEGSPLCISGNKSFKGRRCVQKLSEIFNLMEGDLHNLKKESGALNGIRSDSPYREVPGEKRMYGACDFEVSSNGVEPPEDKKGDAARVMFYMQSAYPEFVRFDQDTLQMMERWNKSDPVTKEEYETALLIDKIQGSKNPFVTEQYLGH